MSGEKSSSQRGFRSEQSGLFLFALLNMGVQEGFMEEVTCEQGSEGGEATSRAALWQRERAEGTASAKASVSGNY